MTNPTSPREPTVIPRQRPEDWGDDNAAPTPEQQAQRREPGESLIGSTSPQADRRDATRDQASTGPGDVVDNEVEGDNMETGEPTERPAGDNRVLSETTAE